MQAQDFSYIHFLMIVWDEQKRQANLAKHGMDFADVTLEFFADAIVEPARFGRFKAIGVCPAGLVSVIFAPLGREAISVISMRPSSRIERRNSK